MPTQGLQMNAHASEDLSSATSDARILVTDSVFPNSYATWRNNELKYFLNKSADILVFRVDAFKGITFGLDWTFANRDGQLRNKIIHVFDQRYLDSALASGLQVKTYATKQRNLSGPSFALTGSQVFDVNCYSLVWHIFYSNMVNFNRSYPEFSPRRQIVHLYPGGGWDFREPSPTPEGMAFVSTHPRTSAILESRQNTFVDSWTGPFFESEGDSQLKGANLGHRDRLVVATASLGSPEEKGMQHFGQIANALQSFGGIDFVAVGNYDNDFSNNVRHIRAMPYTDLHRFYEREVDVYLNLDTGIAPNGWPLGLEAARSGCALATTDPFDSSRDFGRFGGLPTVLRQTDEFVRCLQDLRQSSSRLRAEAEATGDFVRRWGGWLNQQNRWSDFLVDRLSSANLGGVRSRTSRGVDANGSRSQSERAPHSLNVGPMSTERASSLRRILDWLSFSSTSPRSNWFVRNACRALRTLRK